MWLIQLICRAGFLLMVVCTMAQNDNEENKLTNFKDDVSIIIDPLELVLNSSDVQGFFYCNGRVNLKHYSKALVTELVPIIGVANTSLSTIGMVQEQINATTVRIRISPNGYIGINKVHCYWTGDRAHGETADLIIGENPGIIQLKEQCEAHDHRYVECIFHAPTIARASRNGFPALYQFKELNHDSSAYFCPIKPVNITDTNELIFHFIPRDRSKIPQSTHMILNVTLSKFGSSSYRFNIESKHTTKVDFRLEIISSERLDIHIQHNNSDTRRLRLCSGYISQVLNQTTFTTFRDISETSNQIISILQLRPSSYYAVCLRCYYQRTDASFNKEKCQTIHTPREKFSRTSIVIIIAMILTLPLLAVISFLLMKKYRRKEPPSIDSKISSKRQNDRFLNQTRYTEFSDESSPLTHISQTVQESFTDPNFDNHNQNNSRPSLNESVDNLSTGTYTHITTLNLNELIGQNLLTADTWDLSRDIDRRSVHLT